MKINMEELIQIVKQTKPHFEDAGAAGQVTVKGISDYVTQVDFHVQEQLGQALADRYPDIQFMGEEKDNSGIDFSGAVWILDPVDGTTNLIHNFRNSAVSLGLCVNGEMQAGIIYQPYTDEVFWAEKGKGAYLNGRRIYVSRAECLKDSLVSVGTSPYNHELAEENFRNFKEIFLSCQDIRRIGSAAIDLAYVASGRVEAYFERNLKPWDYAAGLLLVQEAGGTVTDFEGRPVALHKPSDIVAGNGKVGEELVSRYLSKRE